MKVQQGIILGVVAAAVLIGGGLFLYSQHSGIAEQGSTEQTTNPALAQRYRPYSPDTLTKAEQQGGRTVIFFTAAWCPDCQAADKDFKAHFDKVPSNVRIIITNYDTEKALKQKYDITQQDTFVQVDKQGNPITQWTSGGQGVQALLDNIQQT